MRKGLLLVNLGSPEDTSPGAVGRYLNEFLNDPYVIDIKNPWRQLLVRGLITPFRKHKSAEAYQKVWRPEGSPLVHFTRRFAEGVREDLREQFDVRWAMRYGQPSIAKTVTNWQIDDLTLIPLYPQYAESSSQTAMDEVRKHWHGKLHVIREFFAEPEFLETEARLINRQLAERKPDHLLLSFHGLPEHHLQKLHPTHCQFTDACCAEVTDANRDCYRAQCFATVRALKPRLEISPEKVSLSFQSRLGRRPWIKPYTDAVIGELIRNGVKRLAVACPSFVADCLETLEEIEIRLREQFRSEGGEELWLIPAPNADQEWIEKFSSMIKRVVPHASSR